jgi:hypothetical protein
MAKTPSWLPEVAVGQQNATSIRKTSSTPDPERKVIETAMATQKTQTWQQQATCTKTGMTIATYRDEETIITAVAVVIRNPVRSGADDSHSYRQRRCSIADAQGIHTSTRTEYEDLHTSSSSVGNSFVSTGHFKRGWAPSNQWQGR